MLDDMYILKRSVTAGRWIYKCLNSLSLWTPKPTGGIEKHVFSKQLPLQADLFCQTVPEHIICDEQSLK